MMNLKSIIHGIFTGAFDRRWNNTIIVFSESYHMIVPINKPIFEIPVLACNFINVKGTLRGKNLANFDTLDIPIETINAEAPYKTSSAFLKYILPLDVRDNGLTKFTIEENGASYTYYGGMGTLLDEDFQPIVLFSWIVEKVPGVVSYVNAIKPIIRISPKVFEKKDGLQRYIVNKFLKIVFSINAVIGSYPSSFMVFHGNSIPITVVFEDSPFTVRRTDVPSVSTTDGELRNIVLHHMDEFPIC